FPDPPAGFQALVQGQVDAYTDDGIQLARLIARAGFRSMGIGGSALLAARYGLPDIGLAALGEMAAGIQDIIAATDLPVIVDGDDGYGDVKSVVHMMEVYTRLGVSGIVLEDQVRVVKQPGDAGAVGVVSVEEMVQKLKAAVAASTGTETQIIARCDAYQPEGLEGALRRADRYLHAGAHGIFIPGVPTVAELVEVGKRFRGAHLMVAMFEGRETWLPPAELYAMGFRQVVFPGLLLPRLVHCLEAALQDFKAHVSGKAPLPPFPGAKQAQAVLQEALMLDKWRAVGGS
ncbi:MAG: isocitrate lyase/phosphoenolpyruvate mutase family protein, partial [candidate division NC10 bacterium]|nr:isocitrate lyase/phosphoenolpyruvate mutase family protein [candidate division NC10 bacterium]